MKLTLGQRIYYTGDMANIEDTGIVVLIRPRDRFAPESYDLDLDDGRRMRGIWHSMFDPSPGRRFWPLDDWHAHQQEQMQESAKQLRIKFDRR